MCQVVDYVLLPGTIVVFTPAGHLLTLLLYLRVTDAGKRRLTPFVHFGGLTYVLQGLNTLYLFQLRGVNGFYRLLLVSSDIRDNLYRASNSPIRRDYRCFPVGL